MRRWGKPFIMSIDPSYREALLFVRLNPSHRTIPEQFVGLGIYLFIALGAQLISHFSTPFHGPLPLLAYQMISSIYFVLLGASMWIIWRSHSLRVLKWEFSLFLAQFLFQIGWSVSFLIWHQTLLGFVALLLLGCNTLLTALLFWKKERLAGALLAFPLLWVFYLAGLNMTLC